jgi:hypothetical protein
MSPLAAASGLGPPTARTANEEPEAAALTVWTTDHTFAVTVSGDADAAMILALATLLSESVRAWPFVVIDLGGGDEAVGGHRRAWAGKRGTRLRMGRGGARPRCTRRRAVIRWRP